MFGQAIATVPRVQISPLRHAGLIAGLVLFVGLGGAAALLPIEGAVIANGQVRVQGKPQLVQSLDSGLVTEVAVHDGMHVEAGALLVALDPTVATTRLEVSNERLAMAISERTRLMAEAEILATPAGAMIDSKAPVLQFTLPELPFPAPDLIEAAARQQALFNARHVQIKDGRKRQIEMESQVKAQIAGVAAQVASLQAENVFLETELTNQKDLVAKGLARQSQLSDLERQSVTLQGRLAGLETENNRLQAAYRDISLAQSQEESRLSEEIAQGLRDTTGQIQELTQDIVALRADVDRTQLRAPVAGIVHELAVTAPGALVTAGAPLVQIIPLDRGVEVEVRVDPNAIDQVYPGQEAKVMVAAFDQRTVPKLQATVTSIPPDATIDPATTRSYYRVIVSMTPEAEAVLGDLTLTHLQRGLREN
jgi:HlyD family secretion protein